MIKLAKGSASWIGIMGFIVLCFAFAYLITQKPWQVFFLIVFFIFLLVEGCFFIFFRDPDRRIADGIVASADGIIRDIHSLEDDDIGNSIMISTFMNVYNVHVNRLPISGKIQKITHIPGAHIPAFKKESANNERMITLVETEIGMIKIIQIAGYIARRIQSYIDLDQVLEKGERIGIIKLGSRVDLILPKQRIGKINVTVGDRIRAGSSTICNIQ